MTTRFCSSACRIFAAAVLVLVFASAVPVQAASYEVFGFVFASVTVPEGTESPPNPLPAGLTPDQIVGGETHVATGVLSMTRVEVINDSTGTVLDSAVALLGGYYTSFTNPAASLEVHFAVYDAATGRLVGQTEKVTISSGINQRYLLIPASPLEVGSVIVHPAGGNAYAFTRVGLVETADIGSDGLADFNRPGVAQYWRDAPFGRTLKIFGAASSGYYPLSGTGNFCYKIKVTPTSGPPFYISHRLNKRKYVVSSAGGTVTVTSTAEKVGPYPDAGGNCYYFTPMSEATPSTTIFWSFPDQVAEWDTRGLNGTYSLEMEVYNRSSGVNQGTLGVAQPLVINNHGVDLSFDAIQVRRNDDSVANDLLANACDIVNLSGGRKLYIEFTAHQSDGYLAHYALSVKPNNAGWSAWSSGSYVPNATHTYYGVDPASVAKTAADIPQDCAYAIYLHAWSRTTNGYDRIFHPHALKTYYIQN